MTKPSQICQKKKKLRKFGWILQAKKGKEIIECRILFRIKKEAEQCLKEFKKSDIKEGLQFKVIKISAKKWYEKRKKFLPKETRKKAEKYLSLLKKLKK